MKLIDKDRVVAEIERLSVHLDSFNERGLLEKIRSIIGISCEVKEIDLGEEVKSYIHDNTCNGDFRADIHDVAEHFFELGLKAQKGE